MAIIGGAGNPVGGSFTGPAEALEIAGDFAYAYSGEIQQNTVEVDHLSFTSGNYLFVGQMTFTGPIDITDIPTGSISGCVVKFNGVDLFNLKNDTGSEDMPTMNVVPLIIPAYTDVVVTVRSAASTADYMTSINLTGRIYRQE